MGQRDEPIILGWVVYTDTPFETSKFAMFASELAALRFAHAQRDLDPKVRSVVGGDTIGSWL